VVWQEGGETVDGVPKWWRLRHRDSFQVQSDQQPTQHLVIHRQGVRDPVGFEEDRLGFRSDWVSEVLELVGERAVVQVKVGKTAGHSNISLSQASALCS
jgi:hypothetical protein